MRTYYVVGIADTRGEFYPRGVTANKAKAEKFAKKLRGELFENARQWVEVREVDGI